MGKEGGMTALVEEKKNMLHHRAMVKCHDGSFLEMSDDPAVDPCAENLRKVQKVLDEGKLPIESKKKIQKLIDDDTKEQSEEETTTMTTALAEESTGNGSNQKMSLLELQLEETMSLPARCQAATTSFLDLAMKQKLQNFRINLSTETRNKLSMWGKRDSQSAQSGKSGKGGVVQVHSVGALNGKVTTMNDWETAIIIEYDASEKKYITCTSKAEQLFASEKSNAVNRTNIMEKKVIDNRIVRRAAAVKKDTAYRLKVGLNVLKLNAEKLKKKKK